MGVDRNRGFDVHHPFVVGARRRLAEKPDDSGQRGSGARHESLSPAERQAILLDLEPGNPVWRAWLALSPEQRILRAWARRSFLKDPEAAHDARSLPEL